MGGRGDRGDDQAERGKRLASPGSIDEGGNCRQADDGLHRRLGRRRIEFSQLSELSELPELIKTGRSSELGWGPMMFTFLFQPEQSFEISNHDLSLRRIQSHFNE